jgi:hypothetical protein
VLVKDSTLPAGVRWTDNPGSFQFLTEGGNTLTTESGNTLVLEAA